jgi:hypothetical protein
MRLPRFLILCLALVSCSDGIHGGIPDPEALAVDGRLNITVVLPADAPEYLVMAAADLLEVVARRTGVETVPAPFISTGAFDPAASSTGIVILAGVDAPDGNPLQAAPPDDALDDQQFAIAAVARDGRNVVFVRGNGSLGTAYGLYEIAARMGARWYHPRESFVPLDPGATFPDSFGSGFDGKPLARLRGFHQHTQHPIVWSDYVLKAEPSHRPPITQYLRYLLRNRQNVFEWHMLSTVDRAAWDQYAKWIASEAHRHGVKAGMVLGFADKQQNAYRLVRDLGESLPMEERILFQRQQVREGLDDLKGLGLDIMVFQFGTTEMTSLSDAETLGWFQEVSEWRREKAPDIETFAWIHTPANLKADNGVTPFFHLPLQAPDDVGLYVHTTMFYDLENPAPVYNNEDFTHQQACFVDGAGRRPLAYFPETAWWLGFDNSLPLFLPITLYSRAWDVQNVIPALIGSHPLDGHVTFTTGIEWGYWMFDDYVSRLTWDPDLAWQDYVTDISRIYGKAGPAVAGALVDMTERQVADFYGDNPRIFFYLAGESKHDEIGAVSGLVGRPVKVPFWDVYNFGPGAFDAWADTDFAQLGDIREAYRKISEALVAADPGADPSDPGLGDRFFELRSAVELTAWRAEHTAVLYGAVVDARNHDEAAAYAGLDAARAITEAVRERVAQVESRVYRYPLELVAEEKPDSLTPYPFGYLWETRTAHFWTRRDDQLQDLLDVVFGKVVEDWVDLDVDVLRLTVKEDTRAVEPAIDEGTLSLIGDYIPTLLLALGPALEGARQAVLAVDQNGNGKPDIGTQVVGEWDQADSEPVIEFGQLPIPIGAAGSPVGTLTLRGGSFTVRIPDSVRGVAWDAELSGFVKFSDILEILVDTGMFDEDTAWEMVANLFGEDPAAVPRPETFHMLIETVLVPMEMAVETGS